MVTVTISGSPGSGKTTVARLLADKTGLSYVYSGDIFRGLARKHGLNLEDFSRYCESHPEVDKEIDLKQLDYLKKNDIIVEGRLAGWLAYSNHIPALKVYIDADIDTRAERIVKREGGTVQERRREILIRERSEAKRYKKYYNVDIHDTSFYDLVVDSTSLKPDEIVDMILKKLRMD